jgi:hypothetical protein
MNSAGRAGAEQTGMPIVMLASLFPAYLLREIQNTVGEERKVRCRVDF